jgi:WD40 repeat protein
LSEEATIIKTTVDDLAFVSEDRLAVACQIRVNFQGTRKWRGRIALYDLKQNALVGGFSGRAPIQLSPDGRRLAMQGKAGSVRICDLATGRIWPDPNMDYPFASKSLDALAYSPDRDTLAAVVRTPGAYRKWILLEAATGKLSKILDGNPEAPIGAMEFTPDGARLITGGLIPTVQVWDVGSGQLDFELEGHTNHIRSLAVSPDGKTLASGSRIGVIKLWSLKAEGELLTFRAHEGSVESLRFSPDGNTLASGGKEGRVRLWRAVPEP